MGILKNLFTCVCQPTEPPPNPHTETFKENMIVIRNEVSRLKDDIGTLFLVKTDMFGELRRLEDKMNNSFVILTNKMDSVILILNTRLVL
jgi:hypothetical protein